MIVSLDTPGRNRASHNRFAHPGLRRVIDAHCRITERLEPSFRYKPPPLMHSNSMIVFPYTFNPLTRAAPSMIKCAGAAVICSVKYRLQNRCIVIAAACEQIGIQGSARR